MCRGEGEEEERVGTDRHGKREQAEDGRTW